MKYLCTLILLITCAPSTIGQKVIDTRMTYTGQVNFSFTDEWQYLSTDLYLLNGGRFNRLINELESKKKRKWRRKNKDNIESIFITAKMKDIALFGDKEIIYPLFNFQVKEGNNYEYDTKVSDNVEVVRIIDKLPIVATKGYVDAELTGDIISQSKQNVLTNMVANQLINLAMPATGTTNATLALVNAFGSFLATTSKKQSYQFNSTIRLYEEQNFDTKLHSIRIYALVPATKGTPRVKGERLDKFLKTYQNKKVNRKALETAIDYKNYPLLVVVNYRSLYQMEAITGDAINASSIEARRLKIEQQHQSKALSGEPYRQELHFIDFLKVFASLKQDINNYQLNYKNKSPEYIARDLFAVMETFKTLKATFKERNKTMANSSTYNTVFKPEYEAILSNAELYLESDPHLKRSKELVNALFVLKDKTNWTPEERELWLGKLHALDLPIDELSKTILGQNINRQKTLLEKTQYRNVYQQAVNQLKQMNTDDTGIDARDKLFNSIKASNCVLCRENALAAIEVFDQKRQQAGIAALKTSLQKQKIQIDKTIDTYLLKSECIENIEAYQGEDISFRIKRLLGKHQQALEQLETLEQLINQTVENNFTALKTRQEQITLVQKEVKDLYTLICQDNKLQCECNQ